MGAYTEKPFVCVTYIHATIGYSTMGMGTHMDLGAYSGDYDTCTDVLVYTFMCKPYTDTISENGIHDKMLEHDYFATQSKLVVRQL